jgi:hypothetical protein
MTLEGGGSTATYSINACGRAPEHVEERRAPGVNELIRTARRSTTHLRRDYNLRDARQWAACAPTAATDLDACHVGVRLARGRLHGPHGWPACGRAVLCAAGCALLPPKLPSVTRAVIAVWLFADCGASATAEQARRAPARPVTGA